MLHVLAAGATVVLRNDTSTTVGYLVVDGEMMTTTRYPPTGDDGPWLAPGEAVTVPYAGIRGYANRSTAANVMWWRYATRADGTREADGPVHTVSVALD